MKSIENYHPSETNLHESDGEIVMPVGEQATIRLKPFGFAVVELSIDNSWVALDQRQITDLRFALGEMLKRIGVEHVD